MAGPTLRPVVLPTQAPSTSIAPSVSPITNAPIPVVTLSYPDTSERDLSLGLVFGVGGAILAVSLVASTIIKRLRGSYISTGPYLKSAVPAALSMVSLLVAVFLVSFWATDSNHGAQYGYLGEPDWTHNQFAYHPILMVAGFFLSQVLSVLAWSVAPPGAPRLWVKAVHSSVHLLGIATLITGLRAVVVHQTQLNRASLTTMHSWIGVAAVALYGSNILWGLLMALVTQLVPADDDWAFLRSAIEWLPVHRILGLATVVCTAIAVLTGVMDQLPNGTCFYTGVVPGATYEPDLNPAGHFNWLPDACKIANGVGISVTVSLLLLGIAVHNRHHYRGMPAADGDRGSGNDTAVEKIIEVHHSSPRQSPRQHSARSGGDSRNPLKVHSAENPMRHRGGGSAGNATGRQASEVSAEDGESQYTHSPPDVSTL